MVSRDLLSGTGAIIASRETLFTKILSLYILPCIKWVRFAIWKKPSSRGHDCRSCQTLLANGKTCARISFIPRKSPSALSRSRLHGPWGVRRVNTWRPIITSSKQIKANQENAKNSSGPKTKEGKVRSSRNALTHGLTAERVIIPGEDATDFEFLLNGLFVAYGPATTLEHQIIEQMAGCLWRLRRVPVFEVAILEGYRAEVEEEHKEEKTSKDDRRDRLRHLAERYLITDADKENFKNQQSENGAAKPLNHAGPRQQDTPASEEALSAEPELDGEEEAQDEAQHSLLSLGRALLKDACQFDALGKLARHESRLTTQLECNIRLLHQLQDRRLEKSRAGADILELKPSKTHD